MDWTYNTLWVDQLPPGSYFKSGLKRGQTVVEAASHPYISLWGFQPKTQSLEDLVGIDSARYVELTHSNVRTLEGISRLGPLKRLELHYCVKLENDTGIMDLEKSLEWLHINMSKKSRFSDLQRLANLKVLCLNSCGPLESLRFLRDLPNLLDFRFVDTNVVDGDLTPLLEHPSLVSVGFLNKRHYNRREKELGVHFEKRAENARIYAHKGPWRTYKYRGVGDPC